MDDAEFVESFRILWQNSEVSEREIMRSFLDQRFGFHKAEQIVSVMQVTL